MLLRVVADVIFGALWTRERTVKLLSKDLSEVLLGESSGRDPQDGEILAKTTKRYMKRPNTFVQMSNEPMILFESPSGKSRFEWKRSKVGRLKPLEP